MSEPIPQRDFKGIWIPVKLWTHPDLSWSEKALAAEIDSLDNPNKDPRGCFKSNQTFAKEFGITDRQISRMISNLIAAGFIRRNGTNGRKRWLQGWTSMSYQTRPEDPGRQKCHPRPDKNVPVPLKDIHTSSKKEVEEHSSRNSVALSEHAFRLAEFFFQKILENDPKAKKPNFEKWAQDLDRMNRIDKRSWEEIKAIITFAQEDKFWKSNVLCPGKLREKATQLTMKMNPESIKHISSPLDILVSTNKKLTDEIIEKYNLSEKQMTIVITGIWVNVAGKWVGLMFNENGYKDQIINLLRKGNHI